MKKYLITILAVLVMLVIQVGSIAAAPLANGIVTFVSVSHGENGPVFTFNVNGKFSKAELKGSLHVEGGADYDLHCTQVDKDTVKCTTSDKVASVNVSLSWGGSTFWAFVPEAPPPPVPASVPNMAPTEYCYSIWDWWQFTSYEWTDFGPHCQDAPANDGDVIIYTVPDPDGSYESWVEFYEEDVSDYCLSPVPYNGPAYYYPGCPEFIEE